MDPRQGSEHNCKGHLPWEEEVSRREGEGVEEDKKNEKNKDQHLHSFCFCFFLFSHFLKILWKRTQDRAFSLVCEDVAVFWRADPAAAGRHSQGGQRHLALCCWKAWLEELLEEMKDHPVYAGKTQVLLLLSWFISLVDCWEGIGLLWWFFSRWERTLAKSGVSDGMAIASSEASGLDCLSTWSPHQRLSCSRVSDDSFLFCVTSFFLTFFSLQWLRGWRAPLGSWRSTTPRLCLRTI